MIRSFKSRLCVSLKATLAAALLLVSVSLVPVARADFTWDFVQNTEAGTVTGSYSGSWNFDFTNNTSAFGPVDAIGFNSHGWLGLHGSVNPVSGDASSGLSGSLPWSGTQMLPTPSQITGSDWGDYYGYAYGPESFTSGSLISGSYTWSGVTLADLNISGTGGTFNGGNTPIVWTASIAAVPEPVTYGTLIGLGSLLFARARRRSQSRG